MYYFDLIPLDIIEIIVSKLTWMDERKLFQSVRITVDVLNVFKLRFPYLCKILTLKRNISIGKGGMIYDGNAFMYDDYMELYKFSLFCDYFVTGNVSRYMLTSIIAVERSLLRNRYSFKCRLIPIINDMAVKIYPKLFSQPNEKLAIGLYCWDYDLVGYLSLYLKDVHYSSLYYQLDINRFSITDEEITDFTKRYKKFVHDDNPLVMLVLITQIIIKVHEHAGLFIHSATRNRFDNYAHLLS